MVGIMVFIRKAYEKCIKRIEMECSFVANPIKVNSFVYLFNCTTVGRASD